MKVWIIFLLFLGFFLLFHEMRTLEYMAGALKRTREGMNAAARQRSLADRQSLLKLQKAHSLWYFWEQRLEYSGVKQHFPGLTAEWWIAGNVAAGAALFLLLAVAADIRAAAAAVGMCGMAEWYILKKLAERNLKRTESSLTKLLDFLGNYSVTAGEITGIFSQISRYMEEPVKSALDTCCYEAATTGDVGMALRFMAERIEHPRFKELVRNMEVSIRYCADFSVLVDSSRRSLREYLKVAQERKGMVREAMINLTLLAGMSVIVLLTVEKLTGAGMRQLLNTLPGRAGMVILLLIFAFFRSRMHNVD